MAQNTVEGMSRDELRALIREVLVEVLEELGEQSPDPDAGLEFRPEVIKRLRAYKATPPQGQPIADVARELGLDV
jgi:hypothetical protein